MTTLLSWLHNIQTNSYLGLPSQMTAVDRTVFDVFEVETLARKTLKQLTAFSLQYSRWVVTWKSCIFLKNQNNHPWLHLEELKHPKMCDAVLNGYVLYIEPHVLSTGSSVSVFSHHCEEIDTNENSRIPALPFPCCVIAVFPLASASDFN